MATSTDRVPATSDTLTQPLFRNIDASNVEELETSELESLCLECGQNVSIVFIVHNYDEHAHNYDHHYALLELLYPIRILSKCRVNYSLLILHCG